MELSNDLIKKVIFFRMGCTTLKKGKKENAIFSKEISRPLFKVLKRTPCHGANFKC